MENLENATPVEGTEEVTPVAASEAANSTVGGGTKPSSNKKPWLIAIIAVAAVAVIVGAVLLVMHLGGNDEPVVMPAPGEYTSPTALAMSEDKQYLYVADATGYSVYKIKLEDNSIVSTYSTDVPVQDVAVYGENVLVAEGELGGKIVKLDSSLGKISELVTGHTPTDICVTGTKAYVANRFSNTVSSVDLEAMTENANIKVSREPVTLTMAGDDLYIGCLLTDDVANTSDTRAKVCVIDTSKDELTKTIELCNGAGSVRGIVADSTGSTVYVTHIVAHYQLPTTQLDGGWVNTNAVSVIDTKTKKVQYAFTLDDVELGAANPWGIDISDDDKYLYVAISGNNQISRVSLSKLSTLVRTVKNGNSIYAKSLDDIVNQLNFAATAKTRLTLPEAGVRAVLFNEGKLYVGEYFAGKVEVIDTDYFAIESTITIKEQPEASDVRLGELYWYDATACYQMWQSCNSCHPDVRADGFNWDNLNDGLGTSKQAKSMMYSYRTPPVMITGIRANAEIASVAGYRFICFNEGYQDYVPKIDAFLKALQPTQSPYLNNDGTLTEAAKHGSELFVQYGCAECHPAPLYTDMKFHTSIDLKLGDDWENRDFDTPSLVEVWRTMPWAFNGYYNDMTEYVKFMIKEKGQTISDEDAKDLAEFVLSIGAENEYYGAVQVINDDTTYNKFNSGLKITGLSVIKQIAGAPDGKVTVTVYDANGKELDSASADLSGLYYGVVYDITFDEAVSMAGGAYYTVTIADGQGNSLASQLKIN